jgi:hypothetical protein
LGFFDGNSMRPWLGYVEVWDFSRVSGC